VLHKDYKSACGPQRGADTIDIGHDCTGHWYFGHLAGNHKAVLQIDDYVRRAAWAQAIKHRDATTAEDEALSDFVEDTQLMHGFTTLLMIGVRFQNIRNIMSPWGQFPTHAPQQT
jgi:hypothetical protein